MNTFPNTIKSLHSIVNKKVNLFSTVNILNSLVIGTNFNRVNLILSKCYPIMDVVHFRSLIV